MLFSGLNKIRDPQILYHGGQDLLRFLASGSTAGLISQHLSTDSLETASQSQEPVKKIVIPKRKKRDELSVLKALASTVHRDAGSPRYMYFDDPYLTPTSAMEKKWFSLARASGQKAAQYVVNRYPGNFAFDASSPPIEAFFPPTGHQHAENSLEGLIERIAMRQSLAAYESYVKLVDSEGPGAVPGDVVDDLLGLLCAYNSMDPPETANSEEIFVLKEVGGTGEPKTFKPQWKSNGAAELLFKQLENPSVTAYNVMICGRAKYLDGEAAYKLYGQAKDKGIKLDVGTYSAVLKISSFLKDGYAQPKWEIASAILRDMSAAGVSPTVDVFNSVLYAITRYNRHSNARQWAMMTINEMRHLGLEPTLTTWYYCLKIFFPINDSKSHIVHDIVDHLKGKEFQLTEPTDYEFFAFIMSKSCENMMDIELTHKINDLVQVGHNSQLLGNTFRESVYHLYHLKMLSMFEPIEKFMNRYEQLVPHTYVPTYGMLEYTFDAIELNEAYQYLPRIWSDLVLIRYTKRVDLLERMLSIMVKMRPTKHTKSLTDSFAMICDNMLRLVDLQAQDRNVRDPVTLSGQMIGNIAVLYLNADKFDLAWSAMERYIENKHKVGGFPSQEALVQVAGACIKRKDFDKTLQTLTVMSDFGYPQVDKLVDDVTSSLTLTHHQRSLLDQLLS